MSIDGPIQLCLKEVPYYMKRQKELEEAYRQYSDILDVNKLGVFLLNSGRHWRLLAKRIRYHMQILNVQLELVEESDPASMHSHISRASNELNLVLIEESLQKQF